MTSLVDDGKGAVAKHILGAVFIFPDNIHYARMRRLDVLPPFPSSPSPLPPSPLPTLPLLHPLTRTHTHSCTHGCWLSSALLCFCFWLWLCLPIAIVENQFFSFQRIVGTWRSGFSRNARPLSPFGHLVAGGQNDSYRALTRISLVIELICVFFRSLPCVIVSVFSVVLVLICAPTPQNTGLIAHTRTDALDRLDSFLALLILDFGPSENFAKFNFPTTSPERLVEKGKTKTRLRIGGGGDDQCYQACGVQRNRKFCEKYRKYQYTCK